MRSPLPVKVLTARFTPPGRPPVPEEYRDRAVGAFALLIRSEKFSVVASDGVTEITPLSIGYGWEHVSIAHPRRCPTWEEMCHLKDLFWTEEETVMQLHPKKADYRNFHPFCLHLWRPIPGADLPAPRHNLLVEGLIPVPEPLMVAPEDAGTLSLGPKGVRLALLALAQMGPHP